MLFKTEAQQIERLDNTDLVRLMKRLLLAECRAVDIPLRSAHVPLQITIADGGEDGRVEWSGGAERTAYLPSRFNMLQSKAQKLTEAAVRKEVLKTPKKKKGQPQQPSSLSDAVNSAIARHGSYVMFCNEPMVGAKRDKLVEAIENAIKDGGGDPARLMAIEVYDANMIADWVTTHPPVALWLASKEAGRPLHGFQTHQDWGTSPEIARVPWQEGNKPRFSLAAPPPSSSAGNVVAGWTALETAQAVRAHLARDGAVIRMAGPSGYGKSRFAYEALNNTSRQLADEVDSGDVIYVYGFASAELVLNLSLEMAHAQANAILVVDECSDDLHSKLVQITQRAGSKLRLLTIDTETSLTIGDDSFLYIRVERSDDALIEAIAKGVSPALGTADTSFIASLAAGFPRMAVLAAEQQADGRQALQSIEQVIDRVVWGANMKIADAQRALGIASLFDWFGVEGDVKDQAEWIAVQVANMPYAEFAGHVLSFSARGIISRRGDFVQIGPIPLAARLGVQQLAVMLPDRLFELYTAAPPALKTSLLARMKWLDRSSTAIQFADRLLRPDAIGNFAALSTPAGAECLYRLLQVSPETAAATVVQVFAPLTLDELAAIGAARRHIVWCLEALVFRSSTFEQAASLLRRLAAVETERYANSATGCFQGLFRLYLSGTEVAPAERLLVLDDGLASPDLREQRMCLEALAKMIETGHFSRFGGSEQIGSSSPSVDWQPSTYEQVKEFYAEAISRLLALAEGQDELAIRAQFILAQNMRGLLNVMPFDSVQYVARKLSSFETARVRTLSSISAWLYFDRSIEMGELGAQVRELYTEILPTEPLILLRVYTTGWQTDLHDPDKSYSNAVDRDDHDYTVRQSRAIAREIAGDAELSFTAVEILAISSDHSAAPFADELMRNAADPMLLFGSAVKAVERSNDTPNVGLFRGLIQGAEQRDRNIAQELVGAALLSPRLKEYSSQLIHAGKIEARELDIVIGLLQNGTLTPMEVEHLSYGQGFLDLSEDELAPLFQALMDHKEGGLWAILGIFQMILYGGKQASRDQLNVLTHVLTHPELTQSVRSSMDGHRLEEMVAKLAAARPPGKRMVGAIARNLLRICRSDVGGTFYDLDGPVRMALSVLSKHHPAIVWGEVVKKFESKSSIVRHFAGRLLTGAHKEDNLSQGIDIEIDPSIYIGWVRGEREARACKAMQWLPIAQKESDQELRWHSELLAFLDEFAACSGVLDALRMRLFPSFYWGSMVPHLERVLRLMESFRMHKVPSVRAFATDMKQRLRAQIIVERKREEESTIRFG